MERMSRPDSSISNVKAGNAEYVWLNSKCARLWPPPLANHAMIPILRYDTTRIAPYIAEKVTFSANAN